MKKSLLVSVLLLLITLSSCTVVEGIFKAGFWVGILIAALVVGLIIYLVSKIFKK